MMRFNFFHRTPSVGLDIGSHSLKWAILDDSRTLAFRGDSQPLTYDSHVDGEPQSRDLREEDLRQALNWWPKNVRTVNTCVQGLDTCYGFLEFPKLEEDELGVAVQAEAQRWIPFDLEQTSFNFISVPPLKDESGTGAFYIAVRNEVVLRIKSILADRGLKLAKVEVPALALAREFQINHAPEPDRFVALIHVGFTLTQVVIVRDGYPYLARDFRPGCRDLISILASAYGCGWKRAQSELENLDLNQSDNPVEPPMSRIADAVRRTMESFEFPINEVYLSGGGAAPTMEHRLAAELNRPVLRDSWKKIDGRHLLRAGQFKLAAGLALA